MIRKADVIVAFDCIDLAGAMKLVDIEGAVTGRIINCSVDSYVHNGWSMDHQDLPAADLKVLAEPDALIEPLVPIIEAAMAGKAPKWSGEPPVRQRQEDGGDSETTVEDDGQVTARHVSQALARARTGRQFTLVRVGLAWASDLYHFHEPLDYLGYDGGAGLGSGPGMAIGAALALQGTGRIPITLVGDGDFMQGATALWTAAHYRLPVLFIVVNNRSNFNSEIHQDKVAKDRRRNVANKGIGVRIDDPSLDFSAIARGQGVAASGFVERAADLPAALDKAIAAVEDGKPYLMDLRVVPGYAGPLLTRDKKVGP